MSEGLKCIDRWKIVVLVAFTISLMMLRISLTGTTVYDICNRWSSVNRETQSIIGQQLSENFSFPEINEIEVFLSSETSFVNTGSYLSFDYRQNIHQNASHDPLALFQQGISPRERQIMLALFQTFIRACVKFRLSFFLYGGSLLGSSRHHDIIPWDDDIDVIMSTADKDYLRQALLSTGDQFSTYDPENFWWKFFWVKMDTLPEKPFRWPYIDIFFFAENKTHIFDESPDYMKIFSFPKHQVFPLTLRPFAGAMLPVPCKIKSVVENNYSPRLCMSPKFKHKSELSIPRMFQKTVPCRNLEHVYPFVTRRVSGDYVREDLSKGKEIIKTVNFLKTCS